MAFLTVLSLCCVLGHRASPTGLEDHSNLRPPRRASRRPVRRASDGQAYGSRAAGAMRGTPDDGGCMPSRSRGSVRQTLFRHCVDATPWPGPVDVPVHVDGASGAMVAPDLDGDLVWDFRLPKLASINTSGHKYGLVYPGVGWLLWRDQRALPEELVFRVNYLGGDMPTFALNFSRPGAQYYSFLRLGRQMYRAVQQAARDMAGKVARAVAEFGNFRLLTRGDEVPVFAFTTGAGRAGVRRLRRLPAAAREGLAGPGVRLPAKPRGPVRPASGLSQPVLRGLAERFVEDLGRILLELRRQPHPLTGDRGAATGFHH
ncbi:hypothetical protein GCM10010307_36050 [Streptomyces vastus]|uniref:glutamate decarboxylase n=1 Tax=Streptomyces vastus TaxID=285451 RepID=A0ABP6DEN4_9ACTN